MPTIAIVDGVKLLMYTNDHPPAHFHALLAEHRAAIDIETLALSSGYLPTAKFRVIKRWARQHQQQLRRAWDLTQAHRPAGMIE